MRQLGLVLAAAACFLISVCFLTTIDPASGGDKKKPEIKKADISAFKLKILPKLDPEIKAAQAALGKAKKDLDQVKKDLGVARARLNAALADEALNEKGAVEAAVINLLKAARDRVDGAAKDATASAVDLAAAIKLANKAQVVDLGVE
jgi:hypothetical protein